MTFRRYFGIITTWYLHSHRTWDRFCHSCIGSSFLPRGAFPEVGAYSFDGGMHAGSLEALRVTRPEAVGLERTNLDGLAQAVAVSERGADAERGNEGRTRNAVAQAREQVAGRVDQASAQQRIGQSVDRDSLEVI